MLVLSRKEGEMIHVGEGIIIMLVSVQGKKARIGIKAPGDVEIIRHELLLQNVEEEDEDEIPQESDAA